MLIKLIILILFVAHVYGDFITCKSDHECSEQYQCIKNQECNISSNICWHKPFYLQWDFNRVFSYPISLVIIGFSNFVGMGAEMMKVIVNIGILDYPSYDSTIFSYFSTLGCSFVLIIILVIFNQRILVDFELVLFLYPSIIVGTEIGNYYNRQVPDYISVLIIIIISFIMIWFLLRELNIVYQMDMELYQSQQSAQESIQQVASLLLVDKSQSMSDKTHLNRLKKQTPLFIAILITFIIYQSLIIFRGGRKFEQFMQFGAQTFWLTTFVIFAITIFIFLIILCYIKKRQRDDKRKIDPDYFNSRSYSLKNIFTIIFIGAIGCLLSGMIGVGASITIVPLSIILNSVFKLPAKQIACTSTFCLLLMSISTTIQTFLNPAADLSDSLFYFFLGITSTLLITLPLFIQKQKNSYMWNTQIVCIILVLLSITCLCGFIEVITNRSQLDRKFVPECDK